MTATGRGIGRGKLILCGEHAVVYGYQALAFAVDRTTTVELEYRPGPRTVDAPAIDDPRLELALDAVLGPTGIAVRIRTDLPIGRGMGSSAALAVALVRARASLDEAPHLTADQVFASAMPVERIFHGNPSGLDVAVAASGGFLAYRRGPPVAIESIDAQVPWSVVVLDTGVTGDTADLVAGVAARRPEVDEHLARIGALVDTARTELMNPRVLGEVLDENQTLLSAIGVSHPSVDALVEVARGAGAYGAKLSGAGGGGVVIAVVDDPEPVLTAARERGISAFACAVGCR